ncbi:MAG: molybdopterin-dependent oxidoreductase, partial [Chloroflexi bacterium]|nr:molybdopterin-dependent oxidoreductase [Chloroflexota bacterium]
PGTNVCHYFTLRHGDVAEGFAQADLIFEDTFTSQMVQHCSLEPNVAVAQVDATGKITLWSSTQAPYVVRRELADSMGMPMTHIRVICPWVGGGFGAKISPRADSRAVALALRTNHRPVRLAYSREEEFTSAAVRHPAILRHKTGVKRDGRIVAREIEVIWDTGAYAETGPTVSRNSGYTAPGPYNIPHVKIDGYCVYTNKVIAAAFRGYGVSQLTWAYESQMDIMARKLGIDPLEMRLRNAFEEGGVTATGEVLRVVGLKKTIYAAARSLDWDKPRTEGNKLRGKGIACMHKATRAPSDSSAFVKVNEDGTVAVLTSAVEAGQGVRTVLAQITGEVLGIKADAVAVTFADTDVTPFDPTTSSSRTTFHMGNAVKTAATDAREQLVQIASQAMEANPEDIEFRGGRVFVRGAPERGMTIAQVMRRRFGSRGGPILGKGTFAPSEATPLDLETSQGAKPTAYWMYATQGAEVEVDTDTGQVRVLKLVAAHDVGRAINPVNCQQQIQGALVMGLGGALTEEVVVQEGKALNTSLADYKVLTAMDAPVLEPIIVETPHYEGPFGAVGLGEPGLAPTAAAIANAVEDAIGVRIKDLPITPGRVLRALREKQGRQG